MIFSTVKKKQWKYLRGYVRKNDYTEFYVALYFASIVKEIRHMSVFHSGVTLGKNGRRILPIKKTW